MSTARPAGAAGGQAEAADECLSQEEEAEEEEIDIESLRIGVLRVASKVAQELGGPAESIAVEYLASGGYNHVWLLTYLPVRTLRPHCFTLYPVISA
jgi:hypothetical protein